MSLNYCKHCRCCVYCNVGYQVTWGNWHSLSPSFHEELWWVKIKTKYRLVPNQNLFRGDNVLQALLFLSIIRLHIANLWPLRHSWLCVAIGLQPVLTNNWTFVLISCMALQAIPSCCWKTMFLKYIKIIHLLLFLQFLSFLHPSINCLHRKYSSLQY